MRSGWLPVEPGSRRRGWWWWRMTRCDRQAALSGAIVAGPCLSDRGGGDARPVAGGCRGGDARATIYRSHFANLRRTIRAVRCARRVAASGSLRPLPTYADPNPRRETASRAFFGQTNRPSRGNDRMFDQQALRAIRAGRSAWRAVSCDSSTTTAILNKWSTTTNYARTMDEEAAC